MEKLSWATAGAVVLAWKYYQQYGKEDIIHITIESEDNAGTADRKRTKARKGQSVVHVQEESENRKE